MNLVSAVNPPWIQKENCTLVTKTENIVETATGFGGGMIKKFNFRQSEESEGYKSGFPVDI